MLLRRGWHMRDRLVFFQLLKASKWVVILMVLLSPIRSYASIDTINAGSIIVDMGVIPQTYENALKPYGLVYDLIMNHQVPVKWAINPNKNLGGNDFSHEGQVYSGGPFIIPGEFLSPDVVDVIAIWENKGVVTQQTGTQLITDIYGTFSGFLNAVIDLQNENLVIPYFVNAEIPDSAYEVGLPSDLDDCTDFYAMPHADPTWEDHQYLLTFNTEYKGYIWAGCHAVSMLEGLIDPADPSRRTNFLTTSGMQCWKEDDCGSHITEAHAGGSGTAPYTHDSTFAWHPVMQYMDNMTGAQANGSERWYIPTNDGGWNEGAMNAVTTADITNTGDRGTRMVFGRGFDVDTNGMVMYQGSHSFAGRGTEQEEVSATRAFFNFLFLAALDNENTLAVETNIESVHLMNSQIAVTANATGGTPPYTYIWASSCGGTFSYITAQSAVFTPDAEFTGDCILTCIVTDACHRNTFINEQIKIANLEIVGSSEIGCYGEQNGFVQIQVLDGTAPYEFSWSTGDTTQNIDNLLPGTYIVTVIDSNLLVVTDTFTLAWNDSITIQVPQELDVMANRMALFKYKYSMGQHLMNFPGPQEIQHRILTACCREPILSRSLIPICL